MQTVITDIHYLNFLKNLEKFDNLLASEMKKKQIKLKDFHVQVKTPGSKKNQIIFSSR